MTFSRKPHTPRRGVTGFTLLELVVAVGLVAVLLALAVPMWNGWREKIKVKQAVDDIGAMSVVIDAFYQDQGRLPDSLVDIGRGGLRDPWGGAYVYRNLMDATKKGLARKDHSLVPLNTDYDLYSSGPDGSSVAPLTAKASRDDILRANNGRFIGPASSY